MGLCLTVGGAQLTHLTSQIHLEAGIAWFLNASANLELIKACQGGATTHPLCSTGQGEQLPLFQHVNKSTLLACRTTCMCHHQTKGHAMSTCTPTPEQHISSGVTTAPLKLLKTTANAHARIKCTRIMVSGMYKPHDTACTLRPPESLRLRELPERTNPAPPERRVSTC